MIELILTCQLNASYLDWSKLSAEGWNIKAATVTREAPGAIPKLTIKRAVDPSLGGVVSFPDGCDNPKVETRKVP